MPDPLVATLAVLPAVLIGLWAVERWVKSRGFTAVSSKSNALQIGVLVFFVLVIFARESLGLAGEGPARDGLLVGGLFLLLAIRVGLVLRALATCCADSGDRRPPWPFLVVPLLVYIAILPWAAGQRPPDGDEPYFLLIAHSLVHDFDAELSNNYAEQHSLAFMPRALEPEWADPVRPDGRRYSRHSLVLPLALTPGYALGGKWGAMSTMALIAALVCWSSLLLALRYWGIEHTREAIGVWALLALTPPLLLYSHQIWVELPAALLVLVALHQIEDLSTADRLSGRWARLGVVLALLPLLKLRFVMVSLPLLFLAWWRGGRSRKAALWVGLAVAAVIVGILTFNQLAFGRPFRDHSLARLLSIQARSPADYLQGLVGLFWDCAFGLLASNPLWLLLLPALVLLVRRRSSLLTNLAICALPYLALISPRREWYGAWSPPFRFGMILLPLLALALVPLLRHRRRAGARGLVVALGSLAGALLLLWLVVPGWTYNLAVGTNHLIDHLSIRLSADVGRFFPSLVRLRTASWLTPALLTACAILFWWWPRSHPRQVGTWATAILLLGAASVPVAATRLPTRVVEFEDRQILKTGGELHPGPWVPYRPPTRGGWKLGPGDAVKAPVVAGGRGVTVGVELRQLGAGAAVIEASAGTIDLGRWSVGAERGWETLSFDVPDWPRGSDSSLELRIGRSDEREVAVILDRVTFEWE